jgi:hypothetical protein
MTRPHPTGCLCAPCIANRVHIVGCRCERCLTAGLTRELRCLWEDGANLSTATATLRLEEPWEFEVAGRLYDNWNRMAEGRSTVGLEPDSR